jgi:hypothetical protein
MHTTESGGTATAGASASGSSAFDSAGDALREVSRAYVNLLGAQLRIGRDLLDAVVGAVPPELTSMARTVTRGATRRVTGGCCDVPPPCWMPRLLADVVTRAAPCRTARLTLVVTNCGVGRRAFAVQATGSVKIDAADFTLDAYERRTVTLSIDVPQDATEGSTIDAVVRVRGCHEWVLRWSVRVREGATDPAPSVPVDDCPDYRHHWYDHFYCARPCLPDRQQPGIVNPPGNVTHG